MAKTSIHEINSKTGIQDLISGSFGENGFRIVDNSSTLDADERYYYILVLEAATLNAVTEKGDDISSLTVSEGFEFFGTFSQLTVTSGKLLAYIL